MEDALLVGRLQFAFTIMFHYLFPQLTMGLSLLIVIMKGLAIRKRDERYNQAARFWMKIFAINFAMGVVTGIPMEFQFGTNWARFSAFAGGIIGQTLAMEGMFAFFLESSFLGLFLFGEKKLGQIAHLVTAVLVFVGSWLSGFLIIATNAFMQHPVGHQVNVTGNLELASFWDLLLNPWAWWQYAHNMLGSVVTAAFVVTAVGAFYLLLKRNEDHGKVFLQISVPAALIASVLVAFPTGDMQGKNVATYQPVTLAAMEGLFETKEGAELIIIGQPDMEKLEIDNPLHIPRLLSFLTYNRWGAEVKGLDAFPRENWPDNIPLLYYSYHIMVGLGTMFIAVTALAAVLLLKKKLFRSRWMLWILMLAFPFPYIANTTGWMTAELGRQPWLIYNVLRTADGISESVSAGNSLFTLLGFMGMYALLGLLFLFMVLREMNHGPGQVEEVAY
jgi:cytochrome d ubiquinol oxidase subunit I